MEDQRIRLTKKMLKNALVEILLTKPIQKVSIKEICEKADINRTTFYKYYSDEYTLLLEIENDFLGFIEDTMTNNDPLVGLEKLLTMVKDSGNTARVLLSNTIDESFPKKMFSNKLLNSIADSSNFKNKNKTKEEYENIATYISFGSYAVIGRWMKDGCKASPKEIAKTIYTLSMNALSI